MIEALRELAQMLAQGGLKWGLLIFAGSFVISIVGAAAVVVHWPPDHFLPGVDHRVLPGHPPVVRALAFAGKNLAGGLLVVLGVVMSLPGVPGQGILTILIGLTLMDFPGKYRIERALVARPTLFKAINRLRARFGRPPLLVK